MLQPDLTYQLLRNLTSPVVAITSVRDGKENGMISDAAVRASIVPTVPRLSVYVHKFNYSHDMIFETGRFCLHLLNTKQLDVVHRLGFFSGRDEDKLAGIPHHKGKTGVPVLDECFAHFECSVVNVMDTGSSTLFLGDGIVIEKIKPRGELLTVTYARSDGMHAGVGSARVRLGGRPTDILGHRQDGDAGLARQLHRVCRDAS